jgi:hypothetical protein
MVGGAESICPICFSTEMQWHDGNLLCAVCGSQSQASCDLSMLHMLTNCMPHEQLGHAHCRRLVAANFVVGVLCRCCFL